jgi:hypothetical protein
MPRILQPSSKLLAPRKNVLLAAQEQIRAQEKTSAQPATTKDLNPPKEEAREEVPEGGISPLQLLEAIPELSGRPRANPSGPEEDIKEVLKARGLSIHRIADVVTGILEGGDPAIKIRALELLAKLLELNKKEEAESGPALPVINITIVDPEFRGPMDILSPVV